jgi:chromate reductase
MPQDRNVAVFVGSLRKGSLNRMTARALARLAPDHLKLRVVEIGDLPLYDQDLDADPPEAWTRFRQEVATADAFLFVTPEYNRSVPGALKNAIDIGSRPYGAGVLRGKPGGIVTVSPGALGGFGANHHLRQILVFLDIPVMQQPEAYVGGAGDLFDEGGEIRNDGTRDFLKKFIDAYADWVENLAT